jgi:uncharacterized protein (UPF0333 family)
MTIKEIIKGIINKLNIYTLLVLLIIICIGFVIYYYNTKNNENSKFINHNKSNINKENFGNATPINTRINRDDPGYKNTEGFYKLFTTDANDNKMFNTTPSPKLNPTQYNQLTDKSGYGYCRMVGPDAKGRRFFSCALAGSNYQHPYDTFDYVDYNTAPNSYSIMNKNNTVDINEFSSYAKAIYNNTNTQSTPCLTSESTINTSTINTSTIIDGRHEENNKSSYTK